MTDYKAFLEQLATVSVSDVVPSQDVQFPRPGQVFVGCGKHLPPGQSDNGWLVLNNKGAKERYGKSFDSVTRLLSEPPEMLFSDWPLWSAAPMVPLDALKQMTLVVEDASPDSVFGVLLLLARLASIDYNAVPRIWLDAVDDWERNGNADDPKTSWCALASALVHSHFPVGEKLQAAHLAKAWTDGLRFAAACLLHESTPYNIPQLTSVPEWERAQAALRQEEQVYHDWLPHASIVQLSLPQSDTNGRRLLVDALLFVEDQPTGTAKVLYRTDREHAPLKRGFGFAAHYRPAEAGTGNDITIAVDPRCRVHLKELWELLEARETKAWEAAGEIRPTDAPRPLDHLPGNRFNQPWYINENETLVGAPRQLSDGRLGSKLVWDDVRNIIWEACNPLRDTLVLPIRSAIATPLLCLEPVASKDHQKKILLAHWVKASAQTDAKKTRALSSAMVIPRILASLIAADRSSGMPGIDKMSRDGNWDYVTLDGGFAVVTTEGVFVLDDWTDHALDLETIAKAVDEASVLDKVLETKQSIVADLASKVDCILNKCRNINRSISCDVEDHWKNIEAIIRQSSFVCVELARLRGIYTTPHANADARTIRDALDMRWGLERRLGGLEMEIKAIETALRSWYGLRTERIQRAITIYGFILVFCATIAPVLGALTSPAELGWAGFMWFVLLTPLLVYVAIRWQQRDTPFIDKWS